MLAGERLQEVGRCFERVDKAAVARYLRFEAYYTLLGGFATTVGLHHIAHGAHRDNKREDGDDCRQRQPKVFYRLIAFVAHSCPRLGDVHKFVCLYRYVPRGVSLDPLDDVADNLLIYAPLGLQV